MSGIHLTVGDMVHYGAHGVCCVKGEEVKDLGCGKKNYYLLAPVNQDNIQLFLPSDADPSRVKLRKVLTAREFYSLVEQEHHWQPDWINDSKTRKELSAKTLRSGDTVELIRMLKALHSHVNTLPEGKSLPMSDLEYMRSAEKQLYNELSFVFDITKEQVVPFILGQCTVEIKNYDN